MGLADRDYMRTPPPRRSGRFGWVLGAVVALVVLVGVAAYVARGSGKPLVITMKPLGVGPSVQLGQPYPPHDRWASFLPPRDSCRGSTAAPTSEPEAEQAMICALNYARLRQGLLALPFSPQLQRASRLKALDIIRCQQFAHEACGREARAVADAVGYPHVTWGENIYAGGGPFAPARVASDGWLNSEHHRENLFRPEWTEQGVAVVIADRFKGQRDVAIWVSEFGERR